MPDCYHFEAMINEKIHILRVVELMVEDMVHFGTQKESLSFKELDFDYPANIQFDHLLPIILNR